MNPSAQELYQSALSLPESERVALAEALLAASAHPPGPELTGEDYLAEIRRRSGQDDPALWVSWAEARRRVHARLGLSEPADG